MALFGSADDDIDEALGYYKQGATAAQQELQNQQAAGNEAITSATTGANVYTSPYRETGETALGTYAGALGLGGEQAQQNAYDSFKASPGYKWATEQAMQSIQRDLAARGLSGSGAEQKELARYIAGATSNEFYDKWLSNLESLTKTGQASSEASASRESEAGKLIANLGYGYGSTLAGVYTDLASAAANAKLAKVLSEANTSSSLINTLGGLGGSLAGALYTKED